MTRPVSVSTSIAARCVPCGNEKFSGSKVYSESSDGSTPSGKLCDVKVANATSWIVTPLPVPLTPNRPLTNSRSSSDASSRCAATRRAFSITLSAHFTTAVPPTGSDREP